MNVTSCGAVINLRKWAESMGVKGILNVAWVNVNNIPLDKRHAKNIAYVGSLVGVTLEIDKATINRPESLEADGGASPKRARLNENKRPEGQIASSCTMEESSAPLGTNGGKNVKNMNLEPLKETEENEKNHNNIDEIQLEEESEEVDNMLLIDAMAVEAEKNQLREKENLSPEIISYDKIVVNSMQIVLSPLIGKKNSSYLEACVEEPIVTELEHDDNSCQKKDQAYSVQSPVTSNENMDVIPTPPAIEEVQARFSKRTAGINMEHVGVRAEKMAKNRNLQGNEILPGNSFDILLNMEIISTATQMGVNIPNDNFAVIDVIRELEKSRANIAKKVNNNEKQQEKMLFITNAAGESSPLNTSWGMRRTWMRKSLKLSNPGKKKKRKVNVVISKPLSRS
ncbi:hypothetical protein D1007_60693 [Hordeum vulgare]|nr:hypothetical protein D1007_60693 [Hordeum vulgare]